MGALTPRLARTSPLPHPVQMLQGDEPVYDYVRETGLRPLIAAFGGEASAEARAFESEYRKRLAKAYPQSRGGSTLFPVRRHGA